MPRKRINISIKRRIYLSFSLLVVLFIISGIVTNITLQENRKMSDRLTEVIHPSLASLDDFRKTIIESKMYTSNWVFLRSKEDDKQLLKKLHSKDYPELKARLIRQSSQWSMPEQIDSINAAIKRFEDLLVVSQQIMSSLDDFDDYDDPVIKLEAESIIEEKIFPGTAALMTSVDAIHRNGLMIRAKESAKLEKSSSRLRMLLVSLGIAVICLAIFLSLYMTRVIIAPIKQINKMINDLGSGILGKIDHNTKDDEIGSMVRSVNKLSDGLKATADFAHEVGLRNFNMPFQPLSDEDTLGKALVTMRQNLKLSDANLELQNRELERKNKELEQFAYVASHDLQEPLRTTSSFVELLQKQYKGKLDEKADRYISYIVQSSERMKLLISDLLTYSRIGATTETEHVDLNLLINEVIDGLGPAISETQAEITTMKLPVVKGYYAELKQLFYHLINNSIKFRKKDIAPKINLWGIQKNGTWQFACSDNGIGIAPEHSDRIFVIFQRLHTRSQYDGSGIGLSHCKKIVELHKGKIWLESEPGMGSTFYFTIQNNAH